MGCQDQCCQADHNNNHLCVSIQMARTHSFLCVITDNVCTITGLFWGMYQSAGVLSKPRRRLHHVTGLQPIASAESDTNQSHLSLPNPLNVTLASVRIRCHFESPHLSISHLGSAAPDGLQMIWTGAPQAQGRLFVTLRRLSPAWREKTRRERTPPPQPRGLAR